jgi:tetratricopeptide (TPR) repeat protein
MAAATALSKPPSWLAAGGLHLASALAVLVPLCRRCLPRDRVLICGLEAVCLLSVPFFGIALVTGLRVGDALSRRRGSPQGPLAPRLDGREDVAPPELAIRNRPMMAFTSLREIVELGDSRMKRRAIERLSKRPSPDAVRLLQRALRDHHADIQILAASALSRIEGRVTEETRKAERISTHAPDSASAKALLGNQYFDYVYLGLLDAGSRVFYLRRAIRAFRESLALSSDQPDVLIRLGRALLDDGNPQAACTCLDRVLTLEPASVPALLWRAQACYEMGDREGAVRDAAAASAAGRIPAPLKGTVAWLTR